MTGRLILEYREGGNVTRLERDVKGGRASWLAPTREDVSDALADASSELLDAATPEEHA